MSLVITKQSGNFFSLVLDGGSAIISEQNRLTTIGDFCNFKTANGANLILKQNIPYTEITLIASGTFTFLSIDGLWSKLIEVGFFDGIAGTGGGSIIDRFDELLDTFSYFGRDGQLLIVNESELKLDTISYQIFTEADKLKLNDIESGAQVNVQSNWNEADPESDAFILNKPNIGGGLTTLDGGIVLLAPQQVFTLPIGTICQNVFINESLVTNTENVAFASRWTQLGNDVTLSKTTAINNRIIIQYI